MRSVEQACSAKKDPGFWSNSFCCVLWTETKSTAIDQPMAVASLIMFQSYSTTNTE